MKKKFNIKTSFSLGFYIVVILTTLVFTSVVFALSIFNSVEYESGNFLTGIIENENENNESGKENENKIPEVPTTHIEEPEAVKAVYLTSWAAGTQSFRKSIIKLIDETEINSIVIDIKDYSGKIAFETDSDFIKEVGSSENRIPDIKSFINLLHEKGIYVIGRITVFQDPFFALANPDVAVLKESNKEIWADGKGLHYMDPASRKVWDYTVLLAKDSYNKGFDEINFDYIRYPSDGNMRDIYFPISDEEANKVWKKVSTTTTERYYGKAEVLKTFFEYLDKEMGDIKTSADLFGMVTTNKDDLNIGQILEYALPHFDYIAPMVYPSHYPSGFNGWGNPNHYPYEVVKYSMEKAVERLKMASTSPLKLRPWLQDFDYGGDYGPEEVRAQIQATYDAGLTSWMLWDPRNVYTREALKEKM